MNDPALSLVVFRILRWSIKHGLCAHSGTGLVMYGVICIGLGDLKGGHEFGEIASAVHKRMRQYDVHTKRYRFQIDFTLFYPVNFSLRCTCLH